MGRESAGMSYGERVCAHAAVSYGRESGLEPQTIPENTPQLPAAKSNQVATGIPEPIFRLLWPHVPHCGIHIRELSGQWGLTEGLDRGALVLSHPG